MNHIGRFFRIHVAAAFMLAGESGMAGALPLPLEGLRNLEYVGLEPQPVRLNNGSYSGPSRVAVRLAEELVATGDVDLDGRADAAVLLTRSAGAVVATYLAIVTQPEGQLKNVATAPLGERLQIRSLKLGPGHVTLETVTAGPGDPACCPASKMLRTFSLTATDLREAPAQAQGKLSLKDLEGTTWKLVRLGSRELEAGGGTLVLQGEKVSGSGGCNRYFSRIRETASGRIAFGPVGATKMACPAPLMKLEDEFLRTLEKAQRFGFFMGRMVLSGQGDGAEEGLQFAAAP